MNEPYSIHQSEQAIFTTTSMSPTTQLRISPLELQCSKVRKLFPLPFSCKPFKAPLELPPLIVGHRVNLCDLIDLLKFELLVVMRTALHTFSSTQNTSTCIITLYSLALKTLSFTYLFFNWIYTY